MEQRCEQFQKAQMKGRAELTTITSASSVTSSILQDAVTTHPRQSKCPWCGYNHPKGNHPASGQQCFNCSGIGHYTAMCKKPKTCRYNCNQSRHNPRRPSSHRYNSKSPNRSRPYRSQSKSPSCRQQRSPHHNSRNRRSPTPCIHQVSHNLLTALKPNEVEGKLITDTASDGQTSFHTTLQVMTKQGTKPIPVTADPGADVNTIPLSCYKKLFRKKLTKAGHIKNNIVHPTSHLWSSHDNKPQRFICYFIIHVHHKTLPKTMQVRFYAFEDATSPPILLSYPASEWLGIIKFKVPNEATTPATLHTIST